jgi:hypothetical protein
MKRAADPGEVRAAAGGAGWSLRQRRLDPGLRPFARLGRFDQVEQTVRAPLKRRHRFGIDEQPVGTRHRAVAAFPDESGASQQMKTVVDREKRRESRPRLECPVEQGEREIAQGRRRRAGEPRSLEARQKPVIPPVVTRAETYAAQSQRGANAG